VAILEDDRLVELLVDQPEIDRTVGNIYLGKVEAVLPGMQAAFVNIGTEKSGFLHASDLVESDEDDDDEAAGAGNGNGNGGNNDGGNNHGGNDHKGRGRRDSRKIPKIQDQLQRGQQLLVQVTKEPIGTKGPRVTAQVSLAGRFLVYMPVASRIGVSRKIASREERTRLRRMVRKFLPKDVGGVIVRTAAKDLTEDLVKRDLKSLLSLWKKINRKATFVQRNAPALVHREASLTSGIIRDVLTDKIDQILVDSRELYKEIHRYLRRVHPEFRDKVKAYNDGEPLFDRFHIEGEIESLFRHRVDLPSGGYLIIEPTEALVSIDVNTGSYTGRKDHEKTILRTNLDAAREIGRQLRLRDVGGIIVIDFIDMDNQVNRDKVLRELRQVLSRDRARTRAFSVSELGLIEMTRQRVRPSLYDSMTAVCPNCSGAGSVFRPQIVARRVERALNRVAAEKKERGVTISLHPEVALYLLEEEPRFLKNVKRGKRLDLAIRDNPVIAVDDFRIVSEPSGRDVTKEYEVV